MDNPIQPSKNYRVSIKALITDEQGRLLMIGGGDHWGIPGGGLEHGENIHDALSREIKEELGVTTTSIAAQPTYVWTKKIGPNFWSLGIAYKTELDSTRFTLEEGTKSARFQSPIEIEALRFDPSGTAVLDEIHLANIMKLLKE